MFGYAIASLEDLDEREKYRYKGFYCGLCHTLGDLHGQISRFGLTYDLTFLIMLLTSLYEPEQKESEKHCVVHPVKKHPAYTNKYTEYAADMTIALTWYKCMDDWNDEKKLGKRMYAGMLRSAYRNVQKKWPRQCEAIEKGIKDLGDVEERGGSLDEAANTFGTLMSELFVYEEDIWAASLREFGWWLGKFIYVMDAAMDYEEDEKNNSYNPLILMGMSPKECRVPLTIMIGHGADVFEKLPLEQDLHLLRSVIYAGLWQKYNGKYEKTQKDES